MIFALAHRGMSMDVGLGHIPSSLAYLEFQRLMYTTGHLLLVVVDIFSKSRSVNFYYTH